MSRSDGPTPMAPESHAPMNAPAPTVAVPVARAPRQERGRKRMDEILDAAEQLMLEVGPASASIQDIAKRAGASVGSIYHFFPTKEAILAALQARYIAEREEVQARILENMAAAATLPLHEFVDQLLSPFAEFLERRPAAFVLGQPKADHEHKHPGMDEVMRMVLRQRDPACSDAELERRTQVLGAIGSGIADTLIRFNATDAKHLVVEMKRAMYGYLLMCESPAHRFEA